MKLAACSQKILNIDNNMQIKEYKNIKEEASFLLNIYYHSTRLKPFLSSKLPAIIITKSII